MKKSASEIINELEMRIARLETSLIQSKMGIPGYVEYLNHRSTNKSLNAQEKQEFERLVSIFTPWGKRYNKGVVKILNAIRNLETARGELENLLDQSEKMSKSLKNRDSINSVEESISLSPTLEGTVVIKESNSKARGILDEVSSDLNEIGEKIRTLLS